MQSALDEVLLFDMLKDACKQLLAARSPNMTHRNAKERAAYKTIESIVGKSPASSIEPNKVKLVYSVSAGRTRAFLGRSEITGLLGASTRGKIRQISIGSLRAVSRSEFNIETTLEVLVDFEIVD